jgi:hypothetical protein
MDAWMDGWMEGGWRVKRKKRIRDCLEELK